MGEENVLQKYDKSEGQGNKYKMCGQEEKDIGLLLKMVSFLSAFSV